MKTLISFIEELMDLVASIVGLQLDHFKNLFDVPFEYLLYGATNITDYENATPSSMLTGLYDVIFPIGVLLIMLSFSGKIIELVTNDRLTSEDMLKQTIYLILIILLLGNGPQLVCKLYWFVTGIADGYFDTLKANVGDLNNILSKILEALGNTPGDKESSPIFSMIKAVLTTPYTIIFTLITTLISLIFNVIVSAVITYQALYRAVKLGLYIEMMPIAVGDLYANGTNSKLIPYCKKIIALILQEYIVLFDAAILFSIASATNVFETFVIYFILIASIGSSETAAKRLVGAT